MNISDRDEFREGRPDNNQERLDEQQLSRFEGNVINLLSGLAFDEAVLGRDNTNSAVPLFDSYCSRMPEVEPVSAADRYAALGRLSFGTSTEINSREKRYMRFRPESSSGIRKKDGNLILLVELLPEPGVARRTKSPYVAALPAIVPMVTLYPSHGVRQNVEGFSSPAGLAVEFNPGTEQIVDARILMSHEAFSEAMEHMGSAISEIMIWRIRSPFVHSSLLVERSSLLAHILSEIERRENDQEALRRQGLVGTLAPAFVLGILDFKIENFFRARWWIVVSRGYLNENGLVWNVSRMTHSIQEYSVTFGYDSKTGSAKGDLKLEDTDVFTLDPAQLKTASHLYLLRYRKTVSALGAERAMRYFKIDDDRQH